MGDSRLRPGKRWPGPAIRVFVVALLCLFAASARGYADLRPRPRPRIEPPMRFVRVVSADPACQPNCPEWLSAEGRIMPGAAAAFAEAVKRLDGRRLPVLIHSPGGALLDAVEMGELIRAKGLAVVVARTLITNCPESAPRCLDGPGQAITGGAICASACVLVLAGGVERLVGPVPLVGVHQITTLIRETEGIAHLTSTHKLYEQRGVDAAVQKYLSAMGVGDPVMGLLRKTPAASVHWLSLADLRDSHLATEALDAAEPILASGANGLNGRAFADDPPSPDPLEARGSEPFAQPVAGRAVTLDIALSYRRGGGAVEAEIDARDPDTRQAADPPASGFSLTLTPSGGEALVLKAAGRPPARTIIPRERFCAIAHSGKIAAAPIDGGTSGAQAPVVFNLAAMDGAKRLVDEACP